jgi:hypothetical protein
MVNRVLPALSMEFRYVPILAENKIRKPFEMDLTTIE